MDIHYQPVPVADVRGTKVFTFGYVSALKVEGLQFLVNRWVRVFMTPRGSDVFEPSLGTDFGSLVGTNVPKSAKGSVIDVVAMAIDDANEQVKIQDKEARYSESESLSQANMLRFSPTAGGDGFDVWVEIKNKAGEVLVTHLSDFSNR
jgi:phage baseplate assembly protein W